MSRGAAAPRGRAHREDRGRHVRRWVQSAEAYASRSSRTRAGHETALGALPPVPRGAPTGPPARRARAALRAPRDGRGARRARCRSSTAGASVRHQHGLRDRRHRPPPARGLSRASTTPVAGSASSPASGRMPRARRLFPILDGHPVQRTSSPASGSRRLPNRSRPGFLPATPPSCTPTERGNQDVNTHALGCRRPITNGAHRQYPGIRRLQGTPPQARDQLLQRQPRPPPEPARRRPSSRPQDGPDRDAVGASAPKSALAAEAATIPTGWRRRRARSAGCASQLSHCLRDEQNVATQRRAAIDAGRFAALPERGAVLRVEGVDVAVER